MRRNLLGNRRGAYAVEFALCLPILLVITAATVDYGWYFHQRMVLTTATQQAAKAAAHVDGDLAAVSSAAKDVGEAVWHASGMTSDYPTFDTTFITPSAGTDSTGAALYSNGVDDCVQVVSSADVECLVCLQGKVGFENSVNSALPFPTTMGHTAVEYYSVQLGG